MDRKAEEKQIGALLESKSFELKSRKDENGNLIIFGYAAIFGNVDSGNDVTAKTAFDKTLKERKGRIAFCLNHDIFNPVGLILVLKADEKGLYFEAMISKAEDKLITKIEEGIFKEMSYGYRTRERSYKTVAGEDVRILEDVELFEISIVTIGMNALAGVTGMKSEERRDFITKEFDRVLAIIRNENIKYEILRLKTIALADLQVETHEQEERHEQEDETQSIKAAEIFNLLTKNKK